MGRHEGSRPGHDGAVTDQAVDTDEVRRIADAILDRLTGAGLRWRVLTVDPHEDSSLFRVVVGRPGSGATVFFVTEAGRASATMGMAGDLQIHALDSVWGPPLPPCPGHPHPLEPRVVHDVAVWICPRVAGHHSEPIAPV